MARNLPVSLALACSALVVSAAPTTQPEWAASLSADDECGSDGSCALGLAQLRSSKVHADEAAAASPSRGHAKMKSESRAGAHSHTHAKAEGKAKSAVMAKSSEKAEASHEAKSSQKAKSDQKAKASQEANSSHTTKSSQEGKSSRKVEVSQESQASQEAKVSEKAVSRAKTSSQGNSNHKSSTLQRAGEKTEESAKGSKAKNKASHSSKTEHDAQEASEVFPDYGHPSWLASCKRIFLDLGANIGVSVRKLFEAEKYPGSKLLPFFDEHFGAAATRQTSGDESGLCALGLEPNPEHRERLQALEEAYSNRGWHAHFYPFAAWSTEGELPLNTTSSRAMTEADVFHRAAHLSMHLSDGQPVLASSLVRTVNLANFIESLPASSVSLVVMDIEGAEYETLAQLMMEKKLCQSSVLNLLVEAHEWGDISKWGGATSFSQGVHPRSTMAIGERLSQMAEMGWCPEGDSVTYVAKLDDPSYATDVDENFGQ